MIWEILFVGSWFFYAISALAVWILVRGVGADDFVSSTAVVVLFVGSLILFSDSNIYNWTIDHSNKILVYFSGYLLVGAFWSVIKWFEYSRKLLKRYEEKRIQFLKDLSRQGVEIDGDTIPDKYKDHWRVISPIIEKAPSNKEKICVWIGYWPISFIWTFINVPLKKLIEWIYRTMAGLYQSITDRVFSKYKNDFEDSSPRN